MDPSPTPPFDTTKENPPEFSKISQMKRHVKSLTKKMQVPKTEEPSTDRLSILHLNDDCLFQIASMLSLTDLLTLSLVCQRFRYIANVMFSKCRDLDLKLLDNCTLVEVQKIMSRVGSHVQKVRFSGGFLTIKRKRFVDFLPKFCQNITTLDFICVEGIHPEVLRKLSEDFKNLTVLNLPLCNVTDDICAVLINFTYLEDLNLSENSKISGMHLKKLIKLKILDLSYCRNLQPLYFNEILSSVKLESLNIECCDYLNSSSMDLLLKYQTELKKLSISESYKASNLSPIAKLKSLKSLEISCCNEVDDMFFEDLALHHTGLEKLKIYKMQFNAARKESLSRLKNLKELCIARSRDIDDDFICQIVSRIPLTYLCCGGCKKISNDGILNLIRISSTIETIDISSCYQFCDELIFNAVDILKQKPRSTRLTFVIANTNISKFIQMHPKIVDNSHLVHFKFESDHLFFEF